MPAESGPLKKASMDSVRCDFVMAMSFAHEREQGRNHRATATHRAQMERIKQLPASLLRQGRGLGRACHGGVRGVWRAATAPRRRQRLLKAETVRTPRPQPLRTPARQGPVSRTSAYCSASPPHSVGPAQDLGWGMMTGIQAAFHEANLNGGVHGRQLELVSEDDAYEPEAAIANTLSLIQQEEVFCANRRRRHTHVPVGHTHRGERWCPICRSLHRRRFSEGP